MDTAAAESHHQLSVLFTLVSGSLLVASPDRAGRLLGVPDPGTARLMGLADLALAGGLLVGRRRWPWMAARTALNVPMAVTLARKPGRAARLSALSLLLATLGDARVALALHRADR